MRSSATIPRNSLPLSGGAREVALFSVHGLGTHATPEQGQLAGSVLERPARGAQDGELVLTIGTGRQRHHARQLVNVRLRGREEGLEGGTERRWQILKRVTTSAHGLACGREARGSAERNREASSGSWCLSNYFNSLRNTRYAMRYLATLVRLL